ncbi:restriction endonuclease subunit S, partial [Gallibacterium anatis]
VTSGSLNNEFVSTPDNFVTDLALKETNLKLLPKHTLLVAMYGEGKTRGKCSELLIEATTNQAIAGIVINEKLPINRKFLKFYMFKNYADIRRQSSGGVQPNLNLSLIGNIIFPFPCLAEQTQIVAILESKLTACDHLATELATQLKQAELLKQAVLKAAFSGKLLEQSE